MAVKALFSKVLSFCCKKYIVVLVVINFKTTSLTAKSKNFIAKILQ